MPQAVEQPLPPTAAPAPAAADFSPADCTLLQDFFALNQNPFALADHAALPLAHILAWLKLPHIQQAIDEAAAHIARGLRLSTAHTLHQIVQSSKDPIEQRRAANTLLRALAAPHPRNPNGTAHTSKRASDTAADETAPPATTTPTSTPNSTPTPTSPQIPNPQSQIPNPPSIASILNDLLGTSYTDQQLAQELDAEADGDYDDDEDDDRDDDDPWPPSDPWARTPPHSSDSPQSQIPNPQSAIPDPKSQISPPRLNSPFPPHGNDHARPPPAPPTPP